MKKTYYLVALSALLLGACTNDDDLLNRDHPGLQTKDGRVELKFNIGGVASGVVSYAEPIATEQESKMETLDIYVFGEDTLPDGTPKVRAKMLLEEIFKSGVSEGMTLNQAGGKNEANISVFGRNKKMFYFVANGRGIGSLQDFAVGVTDTAVFNKKVTDRVPGKITCPLLMTAVDSIKLDTLTVTKLPIELKRTVARFDIVNYGTDADFIIEYIRIKNGRPQAYIFPNANPYETEPIEDFLYDSEKIDFLSATNANAGVTPSAFYMYPSLIADKGMLILGGKSLANSENLYKVYFQRTQDAEQPNDLDILANNRYVVNIKTLGTNVITADLKVAEWGLNDTIPVTGGYGSLVLSLDSTVHTEGVSMVANTLKLPAESLDDAMKIFVKASSKWKVISTEDWLEVLDPSADDVVSPFFTIKPILANVNKTTEREGYVVIQNITRPSITQTLVVKQAANPTTFIDVTAEAGLSNGILSIEGQTNYTLLVDAGTSDWTPTTSTPWIKNLAASTVTRAVGDNTLTMDFDENTSDTARIGAIVLTIDDTHKRTITVKQAKRNLGTISVSASGLLDNTLSWAAAAKTVTVNVTAATQWEIVADYDSWVTLGEPDTTTNVYTGKFTLTAAPNMTLLPRETTIKLQNKADPTNIRYELKVTQAAAKVTIDEIASVNISSDAATDQQIDVTSNDTWTVAKNDEATWITIAEGTDLNAGKIVYSAEENTETAKREATITVTSVTNPEIKKTFTITQAGKVTPPAEVTISVDKPTVALNQDGSSAPEVVTVSVSEGSWTVATTGNDSSWLTITEDKEANTLTFSTAAANDTETANEAVITVTSEKDSAKSATITVTQAGTSI